MSEDQFDEFFRKRLLKYSSPVPGDMWQRIQQQKKKDRKGFFFRWILAGLLLVFLTAGYFILDTHKKTDNQKALPSSNKQSIATQTDSMELSKKEGNNKTTKINSGTTLVNQTSNRIVSTQKINAGKQKIDSGSNPDNQTKTGQYFSPRQISSGNKISKQKKQLTVNVSTPRSFNDSADVYVNHAGDTSINNYQTDTNVVKKYADSVAGETTKINSVPKDSSLKNKVTPLKKLSKEKGESVIQQKIKKWFLDIYVSPDLPFNEITSGDANLADYIKKNYTMQVSYSAGALLGKSLNKHFSVKTGIQYSQVNTQFGHGNNAKEPNKFKSIDIPFLVGYTVGHADFTATVDAGIIFNAYTWTKGISLDSNGNVANFYKQNTGISLYLGWMFSKRLNKDIQLFGEPYFRYHLSYMTKPQSTFKQKINTAGILLGLKYDF